MQVVDLKLEGLKLIKPNVFCDERGFFFESYRQPLFENFGITPSFVQDNISFSYKDTLRGLHFQVRPGQDKMISILKGQVFDVAVDIRPGSSTFGKWEALILDEKNHYSFFIPNGFAHGYLVLSKEALLHYKVSSVYNAETESGIQWNDPQIGIAWPVENPILSERDCKNPPLLEASKAILKV